ncbi:MULTISPECIES: bifunctional transcriptional activator/DNA repair enzyme AdaA [Chryseobacterium]|uniref:Methylated-DNA--protein-cysteine methyltransferase n=1 Tax=Chryseobacterium rhizosphaerae TaxID=395937 RepID=A0ABX9IIN8_9FLAO|nr:MULTISPECIES: methylated-DNA--[protein]-cysteine S-methyltransferase [Chryseobacterium]MBL3546001.1 methylated-DNA--[protein]-cysteine S-methyltransferase [Chryseobacterium sp. KMC2]REC73357.1 XRE family transcriptional regulator [Chryseobacterium rhizosphaerae]GEN66108.1 XRE family transcriptional regulator [Chryseobacterium rhizosphaerae]
MEISDQIMYEASFNKDSSFEGIFWMAVKTTGIFCRPTCTARKPKFENVEFFSNTKDPILKGYRPCKVCKPLENPDVTPEHIKKLLQEIAEDPSLKLKDYDLVKRGLEPATVRRWFLKHHGITFHTFQRMSKLNTAFKKLQQGESVTEVAFETGYESLSGFNESFKNIFGVSPKNNRIEKIIDLKRIETMLGTMIACADENGICLLEFSDRKALPTELKSISKDLNANIVQGENPHFITLEKELSEYFEGRRTTFTVPLSPVGTSFQKQVWDILQAIPYGTTRSYQDQADILGNPKSVRAVANANGFNKISIIIPCHRVIGSNGQLTGYGGGIWRKQKLLELEKAILF